METTPSSSPSQLLLRVLGTFQVSPPPGSVPDSVVPLTIFDATLVHAPNINYVFFYHYQNSTSHFIDSTLPNLKSSLSLTLKHFYPLAGKLRSAPQFEDRHEIVYSDGDSVSFVVAECHEDFHEISSSHARGIHTIVPLLARLPEADDGFQPLMAVQVTVFPEHGVAVGVTIHHAACDGSATISFLSWWAACCSRSGGSTTAAYPALPSFDRSTIPDPPGLYTFNINLLKRLEFTTHPAPHDKVTAIFTLYGDQAKRLKELVMSKRSQGDATTDIDSFHCSTLVVTLAHVWVCLVRTNSYPVDKLVHLGLSGNCRGAMQLPPEYFGNCLHGIIAEAKAGDLIAGDGFFAAAEAVGKAIKVYMEKDERALLERKREMVDAMILFVWSPKFGVYSLMDMGWGRPKQAELVSVVGGVIVSESREGDGGVEVGLSLPKHEMDAFATAFSHGLERLLQ